jgi:hypothetical protein
MGSRPLVRSAVVVAIVAAAGVLPLAGSAVAQPLSKTSTIEAIDATKRLLTLRDNDGRVDVIAVGPAVKGFSDLKVGGRVAIKYFEPLLAAMRPSGQPAPAAQGEAAASPTDVSVTVVVTAVDLKEPSVSVKTDDGQALTFKVGDRKVVETLKAGDKLDITYTPALATTVEKK